MYSQVRKDHSDADIGACAFSDGEGQAGDVLLKGEKYGKRSELVSSTKQNRLKAERANRRMRQNTPCCRSLCCRVNRACLTTGPKLTKAWLNWVRDARFEARPHTIVQAPTTASPIEDIIFLFISSLIQTKARMAEDMERDDEIFCKKESDRIADGGISISQSIYLQHQFIHRASLYSSCLSHSQRPRRLSNNSPSSSPSPSPSSPAIGASTHR